MTPLPCGFEAGYRVFGRHNRAVINMDSNREEVDELYVLEPTPSGWRISLNRYWPIHCWGTTYDANEWGRLDEGVASSREKNDRAAEVDFLMRSFRFPQAWRASKAWTDVALDSSAAWSSRAFLASMVGESEDCVDAYRKLRSLDVRANIPSYVSKRLNLDR